MENFVTNAINLKKISDFSDQDKTLYPLLAPQKKYPPHLAVMQNAFWQLQHEKQPKDDMLKLLMYFSPKVRLSEQELSERIVFSITAKEYASLTGLSLKGAYSALSRVVDALYDHSVVFECAERGRVRTRLVTSAGYKEGCFTVSFTHYALYIMSVFNKESPFTKLQIKALSGLHGHGLRLYPFLVQNAFRHDFDIDLKDLKSALDLSPDSYPDYRDFKASILKPHIDLINQQTELSVQFRAVKKEGRKASHVGFTVTQKKDVKESRSAENSEAKAPEQPKITAKMVYSAIIKDPLLIPRFQESGEAINEMIDRIRSDFEVGNQKRWIDKLAEFGIIF